MIEILKFTFDAIDIIASILGFLALYGIAIALIDLKRMKKYEEEFKRLNDE